MTTTHKARRPEEVDHLLARAFSHQDVEACAALYHPDASVVRIDEFGGEVARGATGIREVMAQYVGLSPTMDVVVHHVTQAGDLALVRSEWRLSGVDSDGSPVDMHHHGMEVMRRSEDGHWQFYIDHPWGADPSWALEHPGHMLDSRPLPAD